jgi:hypothetical protein
MNTKSEFERAVLAWNGRRRLWQTRLGAALGSAVLILIACWSAGVFDRWQLWFGPQGEAPLLSQAPVSVMPTPAVTTSAAPRRLADDGAIGKMRLVATQPGRNAREGTAQLATGKADPLTYVAGALLANGTALVEVHADHVVLKRGDLMTQLYVDGMARTARATTTAPVNEQLITVEKPAQRQSRLVGPETYTSIMRSAPRFVDNAIVGFEVYPGSDGGAFSRLNLQSGDVLLEIDGRALQSVEQLHRSLESISGGASLMATLQRGSEQLVVSMDGAMLKAPDTAELAELTRP